MERTAIHAQLGSSTAIREARALQSTLATERKNREKVQCTLFCSVRVNSDAADPSFRTLPRFWVAAPTQLIESTMHKMSTMNKGQNALFKTAAGSGPSSSSGDLLASGSHSTTTLMVQKSGTLIKGRPSEAPAPPSKGPSARDIQETMAEMAGDSHEDSLVRCAVGRL